MVFKSQHFADRLIENIQKKKSPICVGLDPKLEYIPSFIQKKYKEKYKKNSFQAAGRAIVEFNKGIIDSIHDLVPIVKPQMAFYELFGAHGLEAFSETVVYAKKKGLLVLADAKRNDIGSTAEAYASEFLGEVDVFGEKLPSFDVDALTVNAYLGYDGVKPFIKVCRKYGRGIFILVKTSNPSSRDFQDLRTSDEYCNFEIMAQYIEAWGADDIGEKGYSCIGAVVGATFPKVAKKLRSMMPQTIFLVPGYGAQGATASDVKVCFNKDGFGAIINSSREIIFAYKKSKRFGENQYGEAAREAVLKMREDLQIHL